VIHSFACGTAVLDFVGTLQARRDLHPTEAVATPQLLDAWFVESAIVDAAPGTSPAALRDAIELRESLYALLQARLAGRPLPADAVSSVNGFAAREPVRPQLGDGEVRRSGSTANALASLAREGIDIVGSDQSELLRECARPGCTQVYLDRSRGRRREWCSMSTCGNRAKAEAYRSRHRGD
jgi:predicted RNA-binding Zn ribbon-like protein